MSARSCQYWILGGAIVLLVFGAVTVNAEGKEATAEDLSTLPVATLFERMLAQPDWARPSIIIEWDIHGRKLRRSKDPLYEDLRTELVKRGSEAESFLREKQASPRNWQEKLMAEICLEWIQNRVQIEEFLANPPQPRVNEMSKVPYDDNEIEEILMQQGRRTPLLLVEALWKFNRLANMRWTTHAAMASPLAKLQEKRAVPVLEHLVSTQKYACIACLKALGEFGEPSSVPVLIKAWKGPPYRTGRSYAYEALLKCLRAEHYDLIVALENEYEEGKLAYLYVVEGSEKESAPDLPKDIEEKLKKRGLLDEIERPNPAAAQVARQFRVRRELAMMKRVVSELKEKAENDGVLRYPRPPYFLYVSGEELGLRSEWLAQRINPATNKGRLNLAWDEDIGGAPPGRRPTYKRLYRALSKNGPWELFRQGSLYGIDFREVQPPGTTYYYRITEVEFPPDAPPITGEYLKALQRGELPYPDGIESEPSPVLKVTLD